jgi:hypothetical protein
MAKKKSRLQKKIEDPASRLWKNKADKAWRELVFRKQGGKCAICGSTEHINAHHMVPREVLLFRHNPQNGILLCPSHHKYSFLLSAHRNPVRFALWLMANQPERWKWLSETFDPAKGTDLGDGHPEVNYKDVYLSLQKELDVVKDEELFG